MFLPFMRDPFTLADGQAITYFFPKTGFVGAWGSFIGFMLVLLASIALAIMGLPVVQPSAKVEKIVLISSLVCLVVGGVLIGLMKVFFDCSNYNYNSSHYLWGFYVCISAVVLSVGCNIAALKLDW